MSGMNQTKLPDGGDFCTVAWAAEHTGLSQRSIRRLLNPREGRPPVLTRVKPLVGSRENGRSHTMLFTSEVRAYKQARQVVNGS